MRVLVFGLLICITAPAGADTTAEARAHFQKATAHFAVGEFAEAANEYQAAFKIKSEPALLFDAAQAWRQAGDHKRALVCFRNYVLLFPHERQVAIAREHIEKLKEAIAAEEKARTNPPTGTVDPNAAPPPAAPAAPVVAQHAAVTPPAPAPAPVVAATTTQARHDRTPVYKKWWLWTAVGAVVAGGVVAGVVVATRPAPWANGGTVGPGSTSHALVQW